MCFASSHEYVPNTKIRHIKYIEHNEHTFEYDLKISKHDKTRVLNLWNSNENIIMD